MTDPSHIRELVRRLARLDAAAGWAEDLNPTQREVLAYLARANRFSRSPSHVAAYLGSTRGTVSQSLRSLSAKGYVRERRSARDRRVLSYDLTEAGCRAATAGTPLQAALGRLGPERSAQLAADLTATLQALLTEGGGPRFGPCRTCRHHRHGPEGAFCGLLSVALTEAEAHQICIEQEPP